jgi:peptidoglycan/xylan/chitin deacetylase (PgdA/CDA1 family)
MLFNKAISILSRLYPSITWKRKSADKIIYLTFDDGPVPGITEFVLEELKKRNAKATFFCVGHNIEKHPEVFHKIRTDGHSIGNHTFNHLNGWMTSDQEYFSNIEKCEAQLSSVNQDKAKVKLFRPPYGKITRKQIRHLKPEYEIIMWSVLSRDYDKTVGRRNCLSKSIRFTKPGSIIVFHDNVKAERNLRYVLPNYLDHFSNLGFKFEAL